MAFLIDTSILARLNPKRSLVDVNQFIRQCNTKTAAEMARFEGQWVAWSEDGQQVLAHAAELSQLFKEIDRKGFTNYVIESIPIADQGFLGGASI